MSSWDENYDSGTFLLNTGKDRVAIPLWCSEGFDTPNFTSVAFYIKIEDIPGARLIDVGPELDYEEQDDYIEQVTLWCKGHEWTPGDAGWEEDQWEEFDVNFDLHTLETSDVWGVVNAEDAKEKITDKVWTLDDVNKVLKEEYPDKKLVLSQTQAAVEESEFEPFDYTGLEHGVRKAFHNFHLMQDLASRYKAMKDYCEAAEEPDEVDDAMEKEVEFFQYAKDALINAAQIDEDDVGDAEDRLDEMVMAADWMQLYLMHAASDVGPDKAFEAFWVTEEGSQYQRLRRFREGLGEGDEHWFKEHIGLGKKFKIVHDFYDSEGIRRMSGTYKVNDLDNVGGPTLLQMQYCHHTGISLFVFDMFLDDLRRLSREGALALPGSAVDYDSLSESMTAYVAGYDKPQIRNVLEVCFAVQSAPEMNKVWQNGGTASGAFHTVFEPDGSDAFEEEGTMNVYACNYDQPNFDELIETLPKVLDRLRVKYGTFRPEKFPDRDEVRVVRVPITELPLDMGPAEVNMSYSNFSRVLGHMGLEFDDQGMTILVTDVIRKAAMMRGKGDDYLNQRVEQLNDLAEWAQSNGYKELHFA